MKILKLEIKHVRGIPDLMIGPKGMSFVIYGPNGSGKSAVIDSLDFLLTGKIARLSGEGTEGVSLNEHGPHIDMVTDLSNVEVKAEVEVPGIKESVWISRKMSEPNDLIYEQKLQTQLEPILELLNRGQYVFTRREVLKLITAKSSTRAQEIQKVLKLGDLERIRSCLTKVLNESKREYNSASDSILDVKRAIIYITGHQQYEEQDVLHYVNKLRETLGGSPIDKLDSKGLKTGIAGVKINPSNIDHQGLSMRIGHLYSSEVKKVSDSLSLINEKLKATINEIKEDREANWNAKRYDFTKEGISLLRESGECPLCDIEWTDGVLGKYLQERVDAQSERQIELSKNAKILIERASLIKIRIQKVFNIVIPVSSIQQASSSQIFKEGLDYLTKWSTSLSELIGALEKPYENYKEDIFNEAEVENLFITNDNDLILKQFLEEVKKLFPQATPQQAAWDNLTKLVGRIKNFEDAKETQELKLIVFNRASDLSKEYILARNEVLDGLYNKIKSRFVRLYREMHGDDELDFDAKFTPQDAGLGLHVDFYGRGLHPPHAMHSEGHQDSMGVCLFLALSEHLNSGLIDLIILDDVVMSVDVGHRRAFCHVLAKNFSSKQFIITTHDTTWANQLRGEGLINRKQMLKFSSWTVGAGPVVHYDADMWTKIKEDLAKDDVSAAAAKLRNGLEEYARFICNNLRAKVPYTLDDGGSLGDFLPAAIGMFNELIGKAKSAANSWNQQDVVSKLTEKHSEATKIINRTQVEQWHINKAVHYNEWARYSKNDFAPVVHAFQELCDSVFACENEGCHSALKVTYDGGTMSGVRCKCGKNNWNLIKK